MHFIKWTAILFIFVLGFASIQANFQKENSVFTEYFISEIQKQILNSPDKWEIIESTKEEINQLTQENTLKQVFILDLKKKIEIIPNQSEQKVYRIQISDLQQINEPKDFFDEYRKLSKKIQKDISKYEKESFNFQEKQKIILENLEEEISYIVQVNFKKYIKQEFEILKNISNEKEFFLKIEEIYWDLNKYFKYEETEEDDFIIEIDKYFVVKNLQKEIAEISQDTFRKRMEIAQNSLDFTKETFFDEVEGIYTEINNYYSANNQTIPGGLKYEKTDKSIQSDVLQKLENEVNAIKLKSEKKKLNEMLAEIDISDMDGFIEKTMTIYDGLDSYYSDLEKYGLKELRYKESVKFIAPEPEITPIEPEEKTATGKISTGTVVEEEEEDKIDENIETDLNDILDKETSDLENEKTNEDNTQETVDKEETTEEQPVDKTATGTVVEEEKEEEIIPVIQNPKKGYDQYTPEASTKNPFVETMKESQDKNNTLDNTNDWNENTN